MVTILNLYMKLLVFEGAILCCGKGYQISCPEAFHGGVEVFGREWSFGVDGVQKGSPRWHDFHVYRETIRMGKTNLDPEGVVRLITEIMMPSGEGKF